MAFAARSFVPFSAAAGASSSSSFPLIRRLAVLPAAASGLGSWSQQSLCRHLPSPPYKLRLCHSVWEFDHGRLHHVFPVAGLHRTSWSGSEQQQQQLRRLSSAAADREFDWEVRSSSRWTQQRLEGKERCRVEDVRCMCYASTPPRNQVSFDVPVIVHESTTVDISLQAAIEQLELDGPLAVKLAVESVEDLEQSESVELSVMLCGDAYIQELNKTWLGKDTPTDVLSFPQEQSPDENPTLLLGDVVISVETAARQAEERGHTLVDELRILLLHGLLHTLGFDHEIGLEASQEMEEEETRILSALGWKGKGLISASSPEIDLPVNTINNISVEALSTSGKGGNGGSSQTKFKILFCDMDGTLMNSRSMITNKTANALRAAMKIGVQVIIATGKTRPAALAALETVGLTGRGGALSHTSPGVFLQGLQVYGKEGTILHSQLLDPKVVSETFKFSVEHQVPLVGFSGDKCVTLFSHPLIDTLHEVYYEPKAEVMKSIDQIMNAKVQKVLFYDTAERVANFLRPHWSLAIRGQATIVQALPDMMEILPVGASKGAGVQMLLDHMEVPIDQVMALGDGENDIEMLSMVGWGVAMANGTERTKAVAKAVTSSNDEDGVAKAVQDFILSGVL
ncbi:unnamed protein product [Sphagnum jensenii]|uniref:Haloacid dehalogenase-like hydrolase family protein n=1 Tax=Sphagnum jensenii TaxID=128206 RepID=A0ABP0WTZ2_9BRYO